MFDLFQFVADCRDALAAEKSQKYVREVVARAVSEPAAVLTALGETQRAGLHKLYQLADLSVLNVVWATMMTVMPHNHHMWAVIGIYTGREDNIFWRRVAGYRKGGGSRR
jgi:predicted metal-dependent enzyme (double-stranded beta helix superfamily)